MTLNLKYLFVDASLGDAIRVQAQSACMLPPSKVSRRRRKGNFSQAKKSPGGFAGTFYWWRRSAECAGPNASEFVIQAKRNHVEVAREGDPRIANKPTGDGHIAQPEMLVVDPSGPI